MENLREYLTKEGWQNDWQETKNDLSNSLNLELSRFHNDETGHIAITSMYICVGVAAGASGYETSGVLLGLAGLCNAFSDYQRSSATLIK